MKDREDALTFFTHAKDLDERLQTVRVFVALAIFGAIWGWFCYKADPSRLPTVLSILGFGTLAALAYLLTWASDASRDTKQRWKEIHRTVHYKLAQAMLKTLSAEEAELLLLQAEDEANYHAELVVDPEDARLSL